MLLRIATWNMAYWTHRKVHQQAWDYLLEELAPDIALVQEAVPPEGKSSYEKVWTPVQDEAGKGRPWGSGVLAKRMPTTELVFQNSHPGSLVGAEVKLPDGRTISAFSTYGLSDRAPNGVGYATTTIHRMLSDLTFPLMGEGVYAGKNQTVVLGGDLNISVQCDERWGGKTRYINAHRICFERIEDFGLVNCFSPFYTEPVQTLRHKRSTFPWQNDYLFVSRHLALKSCEVLDDDHIRELSDHNPVTIELEV